jgi:hypothetical protein
MTRIMTIGYVWKSQQNGAVYDVEGVSPCLACGQHSGVEPKIMEIVYEDKSSDGDRQHRPHGQLEQSAKR